MEEAKANAFRCAHCGGVFEMEWSEDEALAEAAEVWGMEADEARSSPMVCDDCYQMMTAHLPPAEWRDTQSRDVWVEGGGRWAGPGDPK